jgi:hypothetical protein
LADPIQLSICTGISEIELEITGAMQKSLKQVAQGFFAIIS